MQGAGGAAVVAAGVLIAVGTFVYQGIASAREDAKQAHAERVSDLQSRLDAQQGEVMGLRNENKELLSKAQAVQGELAAALDPGKRCAPLQIAVQQKQQIVIDKEARIPSDATTVSPLMVVIDGQPGSIETTEHSGTQSMSRSLSYGTQRKTGVRV